ncbi:hypothetical protein Thpro_020839 [Acidihalobacter prosperus]|uniref:Uncharacterized protein n=1 Tax=Acidihalobacter prosperus TaxID=160660 RepID=A0A1A6C5G4_9GAMM|nr:hypothetical protein Thpro_020839 [Acidihalobacter prosperus]
MPTTALPIMRPPLGLNALSPCTQAGKVSLLSIGEADT